MTNLCFFSFASYRGGCRASVQGLPEHAVTDARLRRGLALVVDSGEVMGALTTWVHGVGYRSGQGMW